NKAQLRFQPRAAGCDLARIWFLMNSAFPARLPFEMFHRVRDINLLAINSRFFQRPVHDFSSWSHERFTLLIFVIAGLFANQHDRRVIRAFTKDGLRGPLVEMARRTFVSRVAYLGKA